MLELGDSKEAASMFRWVIELEPGHFWARYNLAEIARAAGDLEGARRQFLAIPPSGTLEDDILRLKLLLVALQLNDKASAARQLPAWPPVSAAGYAAYAAMAHAEGDDAKCAALLSQARQDHPAQWDNFLVKTLKESGVPIDDEGGEVQ